MANWKRILQGSEDLVLSGAVNGTRKLNASYTNVVGTTGANLQIDAGGGNPTDGQLRLGVNNTSKIVATPLVEYAANPTYSDEKQLIAKKYADELVSSTGTANLTSGSISQLDKLLIYRSDESGQKSIPIDDFYNEYTDISASNDRDKSFKLNSDDKLTAANYWQIEKSQDLLYAYTANRYYAVSDGGSRVDLSNISGTTDTSIGAWQMNRTGRIVGTKSHLRDIRVTATASGTSQDYEIDVWKGSAMPLTEQSTTYGVTLTHLKNWAIDPSNASRTITLLYTPSGDEIFEAGERLLVTLKRTGGATGTLGRYYYFGYVAGFNQYLY